MERKVWWKPFLLQLFFRSDTGLNLQLLKFSVKKWECCQWLGIGHKTDCFGDACPEVLGSWGVGRAMGKAGSEEHQNCPSAAACCGEGSVVLAFPVTLLERWWVLGVWGSKQRWLRIFSAPSPLLHSPGTHREWTQVSQLKRSGDERLPAMTGEEARDLGWATACPGPTTSKIKSSHIACRLLYISAFLFQPSDTVFPSAVSFFCRQCLYGEYFVFY